MGALPGHGVSIDGVSRLGDALLDFNNAKIVLGGLSDAYVTEETTSTAASGGLGVAATFVMTAILLWLARRTGVAPKGFGRPALSPGATPESASA